LIGLSGRNSLIDRSQSRNGIPGSREMVGSNGVLFRREKKPDIMFFSTNGDIGFIAHRDVIDRAFIVEVELMSVIGSRFCIIEDGLISDRDIKDGSEHKGGFSGAKGKRDVTSKNQAQDGIGFMNSEEVHFCHLWMLRRGVLV
jgi:hypothetical protein